MEPLNKMSRNSKFHLISALSRFKEVHRSRVRPEAVTAIAWHPNLPNFSIAASTSEEILWNNMKTNPDGQVEFISSRAVNYKQGAEGLKFSSDPNIFYTLCGVFILSLDIRRGLKGTILVYNVQSLDQSRNSQRNNRFRSLDVCNERNFLLAGDNLGFSYLLKPSRYPVLWQKKLHTREITSCEFSKMDPNIFVTSSADCTVKLWDLRFIADNNFTPLHTMNHDRPISSACFSSSSNPSLLVTDEERELLVYSSPGWTQKLTIAHPHRHTYSERHNGGFKIRIRATWHPLMDIIVVGRHPVDADDHRTIDFFDGSNGEWLHQIRSPTGNVVSSSAFNCTGDTLLVAAGNKFVYLQDTKHPERC